MVFFTYFIVVVEFIYMVYIYDIYNVIKLAVDMKFNFYIMLKKKNYCIIYFFKKKLMLKWIYFTMTIFLYLVRVFF